jgi:hypothetical protein
VVFDTQAAFASHPVSLLYAESHGSAIVNIEADWLPQPPPPMTPTVMITQLQPLMVEFSTTNPPQYSQSPIHVILRTATIQGVMQTPPAYQTPQPTPMPTSANVTPDTMIPQMQPLGLSAPQLSHRVVSPVLIMTNVPTMEAFVELVWISASLLL